MRGPCAQGGLEELLKSLRARLAQAARNEVIARHRLGPSLAAWDSLVASVVRQAEKRA